MNSKLTVLMICAIAMTAMPCRAEERYDSLARQLEETAPALVEALPGDPGLAIAMVDAGKMRHARAFGTADPAHRAPFTPNTPINFASVSKPVSAWVLLHFLEANRIAFDASIPDYVDRLQLPESEYSATEITFRRALSHTAGLSMPSAPTFPADEPMPSVETVLAGGDSEPGLRIVSRPGGDWSYSGGGFLFMQAALEETTGIAFADYAKQHLFAPLGLDGIAFGLNDAIRDQAAVGHDAEGNVVAAYHLPGPAGGLFASIREFGEFMTLYAPQNAERRRKYLSDEAFATMTAPEAPVKLDGAEVPGADYGLGHGVFDTGNGERLVFHSGGNPGVVAYFLMSLESGNGIAIACSSRACVPALARVLDDWAATYEVELPPLF